DSPETAQKLAAVDEMQIKVDKVTAFKDGIERALRIFDSKPVINTELLDLIDANLEGTDATVITYTLGDGDITIDCKSTEITDPANIAANFVEQDHFRNITYTGFSHSEGENEEDIYTFQIKFDVPEVPVEEEEAAAEEVVE
ncbi:MAG: hypothetical protein IJ007_07960, partial [Oscillospiraceae bacterium]|nr:hypothetical protein [Oscillospiraceae bacterium]